MAIAKKCDICGKLYEQYNFCNNRIKANGFRFANITSDRSYIAQDLIDCCPECMESINNHIEALKNGYPSFIMDDEFKKELKDAIFQWEFDDRMKKFVTEWLDKNGGQEK